MEILNLGIPELLFILIVMLIVWGPKEMANNARKTARFVRKLTQSDTWRMVRDTTNELRDLPNQLVREAALEEWEQKNPPVRPGEREAVPVNADRENGSRQTIQPPVAEAPAPDATQLPDENAPSAASASAPSAEETPPRPD